MKMSFWNAHNISHNVSRPCAVADYGWLICPAKIKINAKKTAHFTALTAIVQDRCYGLLFSLSAILSANLNTVSASLDVDLMWLEVISFKPLLSFDRPSTMVITLSK